MASTWTSSCVKFVLPILFLTFPFGIILAILLRLPVEEITMASTDMYSLTQISDFWCGWQQVVSSHPFYAYKTTDPLSPTDTFTHNLAFRFSLRKRSHHILRYYLLSGSSLYVSGCSSESEAWVDVVDSQSLQLCLNPARENSQSDESSEEDDSSELVVDFRKCAGSLLKSNLEVSGRSDEIVPTCDRDFGRVNAMFATKTGVYYVVVKSETTAPLNNILIHLRLNRTIYDLPDDMILCRSETSCDIPLTFRASESVVVFMSPEPDAGNVVFPVQSKCKPRTVFYVLSTALVPSLFIIVLWMAFIHVRKKRYRERVLFVLAPQRNESPAANSPLLKEPVPVFELMEDPPPPYTFEGDAPPPPYAVQHPPS